MEESVELSFAVLGRIGRRIQGWTEKRVDRWFAEDNSDFEEHLDRWSRITAIVVCIATVGYILIPALARLWGVW
ncbi:MAG: hypothetical protein ABIJ57_01050 [Pseudomonadota bacterium]